MWCLTQMSFLLSLSLISIPLLSTHHPPLCIACPLSVYMPAFSLSWPQATWSCLPLLLGLNAMLKRTTWGRQNHMVMSCCLVGPQVPTDCPPKTEMTSVAAALGCSYSGGSQWERIGSKTLSENSHPNAGLSRAVLAKVTLWASHPQTPRHVERNLPCGLAPAPVPLWASVSGVAGSLCRDAVKQASGRPPLPVDSSWGRCFLCSASCSVSLVCPKPHFMLSVY